MLKAGNIIANKICFLLIRAPRQYQDKAPLRVRVALLAAEARRPNVVEAGLRDDVAGDACILSSAAVIVVGEFALVAVENRHYRVEVAIAAIQGHCYHVAGHAPEGE